MATGKEQLSGDAEKGPPKVPVPFDMEEAIAEARVAIDDGLLEYLNNRLQLFGEKAPLPADFSDGLLISVLKLIAPDGRYPMEMGRFWQILDRYDPFSPWRPDGAMRAQFGNRDRRTLRRRRERELRRRLRQCVVVGTPAPRAPSRQDHPGDHLRDDLRRPRDA